MEANEVAKAFAVAPTEGNVPEAEGDASELELEMMLLKFFVLFMVPYLFLGVLFPDIYLTFYFKQYSFLC